MPPQHITQVHTAGRVKLLWMTHHDNGGRACKSYQTYRNYCYYDRENHVNYSNWRWTRTDRLRAEVANFSNYRQQVPISIQKECFCHFCRIRPELVRLDECQPAHCEQFAYRRWVCVCYLYWKNGWNISLIFLEHLQRLCRLQRWTFAERCGKVKYVNVTFCIATLLHHVKLLETSNQYKIAETKQFLKKNRINHSTVYSRIQLHLHSYPKSLMFLWFWNLL